MRIKWLEHFRRPKKNPSTELSPAHEALVKALPMTADKETIVTGMALFEVKTADSGRTWLISEAIVTAVDSMGWVRLNNRDDWVGTKAGDNRLFASRYNATVNGLQRAGKSPAEIEAEHRNPDGSLISPLDIDNAIESAKKE